MDQRIKQLMAMPVFGNAQDDSECWQLAHEICADESLPMSDRLQGLAKMNELTGETDPVNEEELLGYLALMQ